MHVYAAKIALSMFLTTFGLGQADNQDSCTPADRDGAQSMELEPTPDSMSMAATYDETLQADLDAVGDLQVYTVPGDVLVTYMEVDSDTRVAIKDFGAWTINASHVDGTTTMTWSRDATGGEAYFTFDVTTLTEFEVDIEATATGETKKKRKIFVTIKPSGSGFN